MDQFFILRVLETQPGTPRERGRLRSQNIIYALSESGWIAEKFDLEFWMALSGNPLREGEGEGDFLSCSQPQPQPH